MDSFLCYWERPALSMLGAFLVYGIFSLFEGELLSEHYYFNYLADALMHGQLHLRILPDEILDFIYYQDKFYLQWPPLIAILLMPFVAIFGINFGDVIYTLVIASVNVGLVTILLREADLKGVISLSAPKRSILVLFFAFGTSHITVAPFGHVWFTAEVVGIFLVCCAYIAAIKYSGRKAFFLCGLAISCALLTRAHLIFTGIWPAYYLLKNHQSFDKKQLRMDILLGLIPVTLAVGMLMGINWIRFGNPFNFGLDYLLYTVKFTEEFPIYGPFNLYYLPRNFYYHILAYPLPVKVDTVEGGSLFLLSPVFFAIFWSFKNKATNASAWWLFTSILLVSVPIFLNFSTGYVQFGFRYSLDFTVPLLLLTAIGVNKWRLSTLSILTIISILHYLVGTFLLTAAF